MAKRRTTTVPEITTTEVYVPPTKTYFIKIGKEFYRRLQPVPYTYLKPKINVTIRTND